MRIFLFIIALSVLILTTPSFICAQYNYDDNEDGGNAEDSGQYLGRYSNNQYDSDSTSNPYSQYGSQYSTDSINNQYGQYGSPYSSQSANNPYTIDAPKLYSNDGKYLGKVSSNPYDPDSISNPYGRYGSKYSTDSVNNPYGRYGSKYSSESANNPYAINAPKIYGEDE